MNGPRAGRAVARLGDLAAGGAAGAAAVPRDERTRAGLVVVLAVGVVLLVGTSVACTRPVLSGPDEAAHLGYVGELLGGALPTIETPIGESGTIPLVDGFDPAPGTVAPDLVDERDTVWVANHPPLFYALAAGPVRLGVATGWDAAPLLALRLVNVAGFAVAVVATAAAVGALSPGRPRLAAGAALLAAATPTLLGTAGYGLTDGVATGAATVLLAAALTAARRPPTVGLLAVVALAASAAALTRSSLVPLVLLAAGGWALAAWWAGNRRLALVGAGVVVALPMLTSGWFYLRNDDLYGSPTAASYLQARFARTDQGSAVGILVRPRFLAGLWQNLWPGFTNVARVGSGRYFVGRPDPDLGTSGLVGLGLVVPAALGWLRATVAAVRRRARPERAELLAWGLVLAWIAVPVAGTAWFAAGGGTPHARYLLPALPAIAAVLVVGLVALAPRAGLPAIAAAGLGVIDAILLVRINGVAPFPGTRPPGTMPLAPEAISWLLAGLGLATLAAAAVLLWRRAPATEAASVPARSGATG